ncbi:hypothetical protein AgCh_036580 [Apium graveolens]
MGDELETYILKKLNVAIEESEKTSEFHFAVKYFLPKLHKDFCELRDLIKKKQTKIKLDAAAAAAAAASRKESITGPSKSPARPHPRPAAANVVAKIPDVPKPSATAHDSSITASTSGSAKEESKVVLPATAGVKKSEAPRDVGDEKKKTDAALDAGDKKESGAPLDTAEDKDIGAVMDAGGDKAPRDAGDEKKGAPLDAGDKKESDARLDAGEDKDTGALMDADAGGDKKDTDAPLDAGDKKDSGAPLDAGEDKKDTGGDKKNTGAPLDAREDKKDTGTLMDAGDKKESGGPQDAGDEKESASDVVDQKKTGAPWDAGVEKETNASLDAGDKNKTDAASDVAGDKKESSAPPGDTSDKKDTDAPLAESAKKESDAPLDRTSTKTTSPAESKASTPAEASATSGGALDQQDSDTHTTAADGGKKESNVGTSAKSTSHDESEISPATDVVSGDKSITSTGDDHKSKTPSTSAGGDKKESGVTADKSGTTDASAKSDSKTVVTKPVNEEDLLREQLYYLNNVLTEWQMITKKPFSYSTDSLSSMNELSKTLKKIKQDLKPETTKKPEESSHSVTAPTASSDNASQIRTTPQVVEFRWSTRLVNPKKVHGFEDKILSLERLLVLRRKDTDAFKAFGIHGMAGVGKTTLCQSIFSRPRVSDYFFPRIWVCLSKQKGEDKDNKKEVVKRMLRCLGIDDKIINEVYQRHGIRGLLSALRLQLTGKRYFIVLDDAHDTDKWFKMPDSDAENDNAKIYEKFSYGLPKECGGTVLVTSRVEQVVKNMVGDEENLRCIEPLTDEDTCWKIFKDTVEEDGTLFPGDLNILKLEIVKRCDGLPLAAKLLGQIKHKELRENPTLAGIQRAPIRAGNQQAAVQTGNQQAAVQAGNQQAAVQVAK